MLFGLLQGSLDVLVMKALSGGSNHGYGVAKWIRETTDEELAIEDGALYTALHRLEKQGLLASSWGVSDANRRAKFYTLTAAGRRALREQTATWRRSADALFKILDSPPRKVSS